MVEEEEVGVLCVGVLYVEVFVLVCVVFVVGVDRITAKDSFTTMTALLSMEFPRGTCGQGREKECVRESEREIDRIRVRVCVGERERDSVSVCACERESESEND